MMYENFEPELKGKTALRIELYDWLESAVFAVVCMIMVFTFIGRMVSVDGDSMLPTLHDEDRLISSRLFYEPQRDDIVVITKPNDRSEPLIKRVIATEGETVDIDFELGIITVDGVVLDEPFIMETTHNRFDMEFPQTVPEGHVFVMGDNRNNSWDSRALAVGMIDERYILGRVLYRVTPFDKMGSPDAYWKNEETDQ
ncbi:MAG: signal peptidase I [Oscillospiraceae bacterium]